MIDILKLSAVKILAIIEPEKLFTRDKCKAEFMRLRKVWHPDYSSDSQADTVLDHITKLHTKALDRIENDIWNGAAALQFKTSKGKTFRFKYRAYRPFELGKMYIGTDKLVYVIDEANKDLYEAGVKAIKSLKYPKAKFEKEFKNAFPKIVMNDKTDIGYVVVMDKPPNSVLLQDLIDYLPNKTVDPKHVAWMVGALYNMTTFLDFIDVTHNSILPTTLFVDPKEHTVTLLGGWWYSVKVGDKIKAVPTELRKILPKELFDKKIAKSTYDRQAVKGTAIGCLGDSSLVGSKLLLNKDIPKPMLNWLRAPSSADSAYTEFAGWDEALIKSFGERKFIKFDVDINNIY